MENNKNTHLSSLMQSTMEKVHEMVDTNSIVGQPITTPDGVTLIPVSKVSFGFGGGGAAFGNKKDTTADGNLGGGLGTGVKIDPVAFLIVKDGAVRMMPVSMPAKSTADRIVEMVPGVVDQVTGFVNSRKAAKDEAAVVEETF